MSDIVFGLVSKEAERQSRGPVHSRVKAEVTLSPYLELIEAEIKLRTHKVLVLLLTKTIVF